MDSAIVIKPLVIGVMGYNTVLTHKGMTEILKNNKDDIRYVSRDCNFIMMKDGTSIIPIYDSGNMHRGRKFDQLILFDDNRWQIKEHRCACIEEFVMYYMNYSCVPKEFQILEYEDIT